MLQAHSTKMQTLIMQKLAIVSTYNENCGNASYTHALKCAFSKYIEVDVIALDLFLLQGTSPALVKAGDWHIKEICEKLKTYDFVNIQFEGGLYGGRITDILRRIKRLIDAAPNLTLTMHRVDTDVFPLSKSIALGIKSRSYKRFKSSVGAGKFSNLSQSVVKYCHKASSSKNVWIKVHTRREARAVKIIFRNDRVFDYPLVFLTPEERTQACMNSDRSGFLKKHGFAQDDKVVGLFGYLSDYKGIDTAMQALALLPKEYKLGLFGSQHPQTVKRGEPINPYLKSLFELMGTIDEDDHKDKARLARLEWLSGRRATIQPLPTQVISNSKINERIRFVGSLPDPEFIEALRLCDAVVLPYLEVGQSMSGVVVLGLESGARLICANNYSFAETRRYFPDTFIGFDMGNTFELAQKIIFCVDNPTQTQFESNRNACFDKYNIDGSIRMQLEKFGFTDFGAKK
jgi:glycosyltransferase involved in cell wall biosynthesis